MAQSWEGYCDLGAGKRLMLSDRGITAPLTLSYEICGEVMLGIQVARGKLVGGFRLLAEFDNIGSDQVLRGWLAILRRCVIAPVDPRSLKTLTTCDSVLA